MMFWFEDGYKNVLGLVVILRRIGSGSSKYITCIKFLPQLSNFTNYLYTVVTL